MNGDFVSVYILESSYAADKMYDYFVPEKFSGVTVGSLVAVPFGRSNRKCAAIVRALKNECDAKNIKPIATVTVRSLLSEEILSVCDYMKEHTLCTYGDAVRAVVPSAAVTKICEYFSVAPERDPEEVGERAGMILSFINARGRVSAAVLK